MKTLTFICLFALAFSSIFAQNIQPVEVGDKGFAIVGGLTVASATVGTAGTGYTSLPTVAFTGGSGATQATGTATLKVVGSVTVTAAGTGYTVGNTLTLVGGTKTTAATFTVATISGGGGTGPVTGVTVANAGVYTVPVTTTGAATTGGTGTGCTLTVGYGVGTVVVATAGSGYLTAPSIAFTGGAGSSAAATATLSSQAAVNQIFRAIVPISDCVISAITFAGQVNGVNYHEDSKIIGKTLTKGITYPVYGSSITLSSGSAIVLIR